MKPKETVCYHFKCTWHAVSRLYNEEGSKFGLTASEGFVLLNIDESGTAATKIAPKIGMEATSLSRMLKNMETEGLIYRKSNEEDKRSVKVFLTNRGKEKKQIARKVVKRFNSVVKESISEKKLQTFFEVVEEINNIIERKNIF
jgi:DNA-binding MarR family transcriptional regulator